MSSRRQPAADPIEVEIESALMPGRFFSNQGLLVGVEGRYSLMTDRKAPAATPPGLCCLVQGQI
jgi:hypothetical protein